MGIVINTSHTFFNKSSPAAQSILRVRAKRRAVKSQWGGQPVHPGSSQCKPMPHPCLMRAAVQSAGVLDTKPWEHPGGQLLSLSRDSTRPRPR